MLIITLMIGSSNRMTDVKNYFYYIQWPDHISVPCHSCRENIIQRELKIHLNISAALYLLDYSWISNCDDDKIINWTINSHKSVQYSYCVLITSSFWLIFFPLCAARCIFYLKWKSIEKKSNPCGLKSANNKRHGKS